MKFILPLLLLVFLISKPVIAQQNAAVKKQVHYSVEQFLAEDEVFNQYIYPVPAIPKADLLDFIKQKISYPERAKKNFQQMLLTVSLVINADGKAIFDTSNYEKGISEFKDIAFNILRDTAMKWKPARKGKKNVEMRIRVPFYFYFNFENEKIYFNVEVFHNLTVFTLDSTDTYPAILPTEKKGYLLSSFNFLTPAAENNEKPYGAVEIAFEVDTAGIISEQKIGTSISNVIDAQAMEYIKKSNGKWIPARKNGLKVPSYKTFHCMFNDVYINEKENKSTHGQSYIYSRKFYELNLNGGFNTYLTLAADDKFQAIVLFNQKKYSESLVYLNRAAKYYIHDVNLFFNRFIANHHVGNKEKSCDDLQRVLDIADIYGFPGDLSKEKINALMWEFCRE